MSFAGRLSDTQWRMLAAAAVVIPVAAMLVLSARSSKPTEPVTAPMASVSAPRPASVVTPDDSDRNIARLVAAEQAMQQAQAALKAANYAFSTPEIPVRGKVWSMVDDASEVPSLELNPQIAHAEVIRLPDPQALEKTPGDRLTIPLLEGRSLAVTVEDANRLPNGDYSWRGYVEGEGDDFPVIFTVGKNSAFATITSWEGSYTMEAVGGVGWLYRNIADRGEDAVAVPVGTDTARYN